MVPPRPVREAVEAVRETLKDAAPGAKWVHPSLWHLTLKFLGEVEDELVPAVMDLAAEVASRRMAFEVSLKHTGVFPNKDRPRVLWVGLDAGRDQLAELALELDEGLDGLGFEAESRKHEPHLTIARFREPRQMGEMGPMLGETEEIGRFVVDEVVLMRSVLRPRGPDYTVVEKLPLEPNPDLQPDEDEDETSAEEATDTEGTADDESGEAGTDGDGGEE